MLFPFLCSLVSREGTFLSDWLHTRLFGKNRSDAYVKACVGM
ncbi:MAG: hypothetical protein Sw2PiMacB_37620 [Shewanella algae]